MKHKEKYYGWISTEKFIDIQTMKLEVHASWEDTHFKSTNLSLCYCECNHMLVITIVLRLLYRLVIGLSPKLDYYPVLPDFGFFYYFIPKNGNYLVISTTIWEDIEKEQSTT